MPESSGQPELFTSWDYRHLLRSLADLPGMDQAEGVEALKVGIPRSLKLFLYCPDPCRYSQERDVALLRFLESVVDYSQPATLPRTPGEPPIATVLFNAALIARTAGNTISENFWLNQATQVQEKLKVLQKGE